MNKKLGVMGWERDLPDHRDYTKSHPLLVRERVEKFFRNMPKKLPSMIDLRRWCFPIADSHTPGSCTAKAVVGLIEYLEFRASSRKAEIQSFFLAEDMGNWLDYPGDSKAYLRSAFKAISEYGVLGNYYRLDPIGTNPTQLLHEVKCHLCAELPVAFGFSVFSSVPGIGEYTADIRFPKDWDYLVGGLSAVIVGYDDHRMIQSDKGALLIMNSWGTNWGEHGYGWIPYNYIKAGLAADFWCYIKTGISEFP